MTRFFIVLLGLFGLTLTSKSNIELNKAIFGAKVTPAAHVAGAGTNMSGAKKS